MVLARRPRRPSPPRGRSRASRPALSGIAAPRPRRFSPVIKSSWARVVRAMSWDQVPAPGEGAIRAARAAAAPPSRCRDQRGCSAAAAVRKA